MSASLFLAEMYPTDDPLMVQLRTQVAEIARTPGLVTVLIEGAPGTGKTTMARVIAMARTLSMIDPQYHGLSVERAAREVREGAALKWYRDISLAGLTESLADSQLFGVGKGIATEVAGRIGIFEQAMTGCLDPKTAKSHGDLIADARSNDLVPLATGGVVLLDEIGDLAPQLQAKLLRVLNGEMQFRLGMEGNVDFGCVFRGVVALATWRDVDGDCELRDDLRQRICQHRIRVPGLSEYPSAARRQMVLSVAEVVRKGIQDELVFIDGLVARGGENDSATVLASDWLAHANRAADAKLSATMVSKLVEADWSRYGQLRGLRATLRRVLCGAELDAALAETQTAFSQNRQPLELEPSVARLGRYLVDGNSFPDAWMKDRREWASEILRRLDRDDPAVQHVVSEMGRSTAEVRKQLHNLMRSGSKLSGN